MNKNHRLIVLDDYVGEVTSDDYRYVMRIVDMNKYLRKAETIIFDEQNNVVNRRKRIIHHDKDGWYILFRSRHRFDISLMYE